MQAPTYNQAHAEQLLHLSDLLNKPVLLRNEKIGALGDLVIVDKDLVAEVTHVMVRRPFGRPSWFVPWHYVHSLTDKSLVLDQPGCPAAVDVDRTRSVGNRIGRVGDVGVKGVFFAAHRRGRMMRA